MGIDNLCCERLVWRNGNQSGEFGTVLGLRHSAPRAYPPRTHLSFSFPSFRPTLPHLSVCAPSLATSADDISRYGHGTTPVEAESVVYTVSSGTEGHMEGADPTASVLL